MKMGQRGLVYMGTNKTATLHTHLFLDDIEVYV